MDHVPSFFLLFFFFLILFPFVFIIIWTWSLDFKPEGQIHFFNFFLSLNHSLYSDGCSDLQSWEEDRRNKLRNIPSLYLLLLSNFFTSSPVGCWKLSPEMSFQDLSVNYWRDIISFFLKLYSNRFEREKNFVAWKKIYFMLIKFTDHHSFVRSLITSIWTQNTWMTTISFGSKMPTSFESLNFRLCLINEKMLTGSKGEKLCWQD